MERVQGQAQVPENGAGEAGSLRSKPQIQSEAQGKEERKNRCRRWCEGHHKKIFFRAPAIALVDMKKSNAAGGRRCNASVPMHVAGLLSEFWSARDVGGSAIPAGDELFRISPDILIHSTQFR
jgi:hypothetical protein